MKRVIVQLYNSALPGGPATVMKVLAEGERANYDLLFSPITMGEDRSNQVERFRVWSTHDQVRVGEKLVLPSVPVADYVPVLKWILIVPSPEGEQDHRLFKDGEGRISVCDWSGHSPDQMDDGPLLLIEKGDAELHISELYRGAMRVRYECEGENGRRSFVDSGLHVLSALQGFDYKIMVAEKLLRSLEALQGIGMLEFNPAFYKKDRIRRPNRVIIPVHTEDGEKEKI